MSGTKKKQTGGESPLLVDVIEMFVFAAIAVILLFTFGFRQCVVDGPSMENTLYHGERLIISDFFYKPKAGDIVVFHQTSEVSDRFNEPIVKRVIATGGQYVKIDYVAAKVYVSADDVFDENEVIDESSYACFKGRSNTWEEGESGFKTAEIFHVPEGELFVMGDNRNNSADSRYAVIGTVDERRILGRVIFRLTPLSSCGTVH